MDVDAPAAKKQKRSCADISFSAQAYEIFKDYCSEDLVKKLRDLGRELHVRPDRETLWLSFCRFAFGVADRKHGLPDARFSEEARAALASGLLAMDRCGEYLMDQQDVLHAPARKRAREAAKLFASLQASAARASMEAESTEQQELRVMHVWLYLLCSSVYAGESDFIGRFVLDDMYHHDAFEDAFHAYLKAGGSDVKTLVKNRLLFLALTRSEVNVFFNPHDGRRLCDTRGVYNDIECAQEDDRLLVVPCDDLDEGDISYPAQETDDISKSGCPRVACRSRWLDTMLALQDTWWDAARQCAEQVVALVKNLRRSESEDMEFAVSRAKRAEQATETLLNTFIAIPLIGAPKFST